MKTLSRGSLGAPLDCLGAILGGLEAVLGGLGAILGDLGGVLGRSWAVLGRSWAILGRSWAILGRSWAVLGRSKIDQKTDPKLDSKTGRIATEKNGPNTTPVVVSAISVPQRDLDPTTQKNYQNGHRYD